MANANMNSKRWVVDPDGSINDNDFEHDTRLLMSGDFESDAQRAVFAQAIADALNAWPAINGAAQTSKDHP